MSFIDATCPKCSKRFGWTGNLVDKPPCPKCGWKDDPEKLKKIQEEMQKKE